MDPDHDPSASFVEAPARSTARALEPLPPEVAPTAARPEPRPGVEVWAETTPNPDAMKFIANVPVAPRGAVSFDDARAAADNPLGRAIFSVPGVRSMFAVNDFVTVTRAPGADWATLAPALEAAIASAL